jgi:hypothetical protein
MPTAKRNAANSGGEASLPPINDLNVPRSAPSESETLPPFLTDADLKRGGLMSIQAFVRSDERPKSTKQQDLRARQAAAGIRQINLCVPDNEACRTALKAVANAVTQNVLHPEDVIALVAAHTPGHHPTPKALWTDLLSCVLGLWRYFIIQRGWRTTLRLLIAGVGTAGSRHHSRQRM